MRLLLMNPSLPQLFHVFEESLSGNPLHFMRNLFYVISFSHSITTKLLPCHVFNFLSSDEINPNLSGVR